MRLHPNPNQNPNIISHTNSGLTPVMTALSKNLLFSNLAFSVSGR
jgi:hypothetical protein